MARDVFRGVDRWRDPGFWRALAGGAVLLVATSGVVLLYATEPASPADLADRVVLALDPDAYGANLRLAGRRLVRAIRADALGSEVEARALRWTAAHGFARAGEAAGSPAQSLAANDRAARVYLELGWAGLERGRGRVLGLGRSEEELRLAERAAVCMVGLAPTRLRAEINRFREELEDALGRAPTGSCPR